MNKKTPKKTKIVAYISGGNLQTVMSTTKNIDVVLIDQDNLLAEGKTGKDIIDILRKETKGMTAVVY